ncbi:hypothetical protein BaRGS_00031482 [Batillaria attramentaria]|uniref:Uncharacterized protein n=1 Tax=Batillaria attramentaria TaxID=370345 RepID=A0ABD0JRN2_9CAEN
MQNDKREAGEATDKTELSAINQACVNFDLHNGPSLSDVMQAEFAEVDETSEEQLNDAELETLDESSG